MGREKNDEEGQDLEGWTNLLRFDWSKIRIRDTREKKNPMRRREDWLPLILACVYAYTHGPWRRRG
jgi:hypothetical protein